MEKLIEQVRAELPTLKILENEPMSGHCTFRIGGPVRAMALPENETELAAVCAILRKEGVRPVILGNGSNLLVSDRPLNCFAIKTERLCKITQNDISIEAGAGISLARLAVYAQRNGLTGLEFAHGIPGSLGGAVLMNAGAYGSELKDVLTRATYLTESGELVTQNAAELDLSYRHSIFCEMDAVILGAGLRLKKDKIETIRARMVELQEKRRASQPLDRASAGSTFKRPNNGYAAVLIDEAGLRGFRIGGAAVSEKHAGFVVNMGNASFDDVLRVMEHVKTTVSKKFGVELEPEVRIWNF